MFIQKHTESNQKRWSTASNWRRLTFKCLEWYNMYPPGLPRLSQPCYLPCFSIVFPRLVNDLPNVKTSWRYSTFSIIHTIILFHDVNNYSASTSSTCMSDTWVRYEGRKRIERDCMDINAAYETKRITPANTCILGIGKKVRYDRTLWTVDLHMQMAKKTGWRFQS